MVEECCHLFKTRHMNLKFYTRSKIILSLCYMLIRIIWLLIVLLRVLPKKNLN